MTSFLVSRLRIRISVVMPTCLAIVSIMLTGCPGMFNAHEKSSEKELTSFGFSNPSAEGIIDGSTESISIFVPRETDLNSAIIANFSTTGEMVKVGTKRQISGSTPNIFSSPVLYKVEAEDGSEKTYTVIVSHIKDSSKAISVFRIDSLGEDAYIDEIAHSIVLSVPYGTDVTSLVASFSTTGIKVSVGGVTQQSGTTINDFTQAVIYTVTADDGSKQEYAVTVTVDTLPPSSGNYGSPTASRTTGVAPLYVHFSADFTGDPAAARGFRDYEYSWNFGDPTSGDWGTNGASRNLAKGGIAAHVYELPGTYSVSLFVRDGQGKLGQKTFTIKVDDPDLYYAGNKTICVSDEASNDFAGAPAGARLVATDDLADITGYATAGSRILFRRGSSWNTGGLSWPENGGPVTIGAYGAGIGADALGNYENAPVITVTSGSFLPLDCKQDWRIMDLHFREPTRTDGRGAFGGSMEMQRILFLRLQIEGFYTGFGWTHWNTSLLMTLDQMAIVSCHMWESQDNIAYVGSERLAILGNILQNVRESHVLRVWQAYRSVISDNIVSGSSLGVTSDGRHALKLHGPGYSQETDVDEYDTPVPDSAYLGHHTEYTVVSGNVFGSSGPWPVTIGPQDAATDAELYNIVFERNRVISEFGEMSPQLVQIAMSMWGRNSTIRNNIFDGTGSSPDYTAITIEQRGVEPAPDDIDVYNNTIHRSDNADGNYRIGISVGPTATDVDIKNNLVSFPGDTVVTIAVNDLSTVAVSAGNMLAETNFFIDPDAVDPLARDFRLMAGNPASDHGVAVPVLEDFSGDARPVGAYDIGAFED